MAAGRTSPAATGPNSTPPASPAPSNPQPLASIEDITDGGGLILADDKLVLTRSGNAVRGFSALCTHKGCTVNAVRDGKILCPCHGSQYDAATGAVVAGPAPRPLPSVPITVLDGKITRS